MKINDKNLKKKFLDWAYLAGFFIILALPILAWPPYFFPPDFGKSIIFRSVLAILLFLFVFQFLFRKKEISLPNIKNNPIGSRQGGTNGASKIILALAALFVVFLLASIFSVDPYFSFWGSPWRGGGFITFAFYFVFAVLSFILFKNKDPSTGSGLSWKKAWDFSIIVGILVSLVAVIQYYGLFNRIFLSAGRPSSTMGNPIMLGVYLLLLSFITLSFAIKEKKVIYKIFYIFALLLFLYVILISNSRAAYLGLLTGTVFFILFYPKRLLILKVLTIACLILGAFAVYYVNSNDNIPEFLENNRIFQAIRPRLSLKLVLVDPRFYAWSKIDYKILAEKPILGWGPENFSVGFDKYYDPSIPYLSRDWGAWWDRAHNILLDIGAQAGMLGIISYLTLFLTLFWHLQKLKNPQLMAHGIQATLIGYLVANFFSFDSFSTYLIFFLLIGYSLHLALPNDSGISGNPPSSVAISRNKYKTPIIIVLFILLVLFLWQYNILPLKINAEINKASDLANRKYCGRALGLMDKILPKHSFLDSYARMEYVEFTKTCNDYFPENNLTYIKRGAELISEAVKIQPLYTRYWILLGSSTTILAAQEKNADAKNNLLKQASSYFDKAGQLGPKHQEVLIGRAKMEIVAGDYEKAKKYSEKCIALDPNLGDCYWYLGLAQIYLKDIAAAKKTMQAADYDINSKVSLGELSDAYGSISDYKDLVPVYEKLIALNPNVAQYHSSLAFFYKQLGEYGKARQEALMVLKLSPESKENVDAFLKTLP